MTYAIKCGEKRTIMKELFNATKNSINHVTGDAFIVPNHARRFGNATFESIINRYKKVAEENGVTEDSKFIEVWIVSKDLKTDNLCDHGAHVLCDGEEVVIHPRISYIPEELFQGKKEGEHVTVKFTDNDIPFEIDLRLSQKEYRYARFGTFEEVLEVVTR